jgi:hypothetical protein
MATEVIEINKLIFVANLQKHKKLKMFTSMQTKYILYLFKYCMHLFS